MFAQSKGGNYSLTNGASGLADAIDFDGTTDYLSRNADLVGNTDGKTFTFSAWVWINNDGVTSSIYTVAVSAGGAERVYFDYSGSGGWAFVGRNPAGNVVLYANGSNQLPKNTFNHFLMSVDLTNSANRGVRINDIEPSVTWVTYANDVIDFANPYHFVGRGSNADAANGRLSHVYLDYAYRDLSVEANRRIFVLP